MAFGALIFAMGGFAMAASNPGGGRIIHACVKTKGKSKGILRVVNSTKCRKREKAISFNQKGQPGPAGKEGPPGSAAQFKGAAAGGALAGAYPNPSLATPEPVHLVGAPGEPAFAPNARNQDQSGRFDSLAGFYKDGLGRVQLQGTVDANVGGNGVIFTLPAGYRPPGGGSCFAVPAFVPAGAGTFTFTQNRICVTSTGDVLNDRGTGTDIISLEGVSFRAGG